MTAYEDTVELTGKGNVENNAELLASVELTGKGASAIESGGLSFQALVELIGKGNVPSLKFSGSYADWQYRKAITLSNGGGALSTYQKLITLTTANFDYSKCKNDGGDIRFTASGAETALPYWIEDWNYNGDSKIWVKVDSIPGGSNACLYVFYGKNDATSESNFDNTFISGEPWDNATLDAEKWPTVNGAPTYSINTTDHYLEVTNVANGWETGNGFTSKLFNFPAEYIIERARGSGGFQLYINSTVAELTQILFGNHHGAWGSSDRGVAFATLIDAWDSNTHRRSAGVGGSADYNSGSGQGQTATVEWTIYKLGSDITIKEATTTRVSETNAETPDRIHIGLSKYSTRAFGTIRVYDFKIRKYANPEPTVESFSEEEMSTSLCTLTLYQSAEITGKGDPTILPSFQLLAELTATGSVSADITWAQHELLEFTGVSDFLPLHTYVFSDIGSFLIEGWSVSKTIQDVLWKFSGGIDKLTTPTYFKNFVVTADDHQDPPVNHVIFLGFIPGASYVLATVTDKAILNAFDYGWYLSSQFVPLSIRITDEDTNPADTIKTLLGGVNWMSTTGIEPYQIRNVTDWVSIKKEFIFDSKTSKWKAIKEICEYTHHVFMVKWRKTDNDEYYSVAYFVHEDEIDTYLDLPTMETINLPDPYLMQDVKIEDKQEAKYNRVTVNGVDKISGTWYTKTIEAASVTSEDELPIEYVYESTDLGSQSKVDAKATELYNFFHTIARIYTASFKKRMDLELYQKIKFIGYDKIEEEEMRIVGITYRRSAVEDIVTIQFTPDQKLADLRKLMRSMGADFMTEQQRIQEDFFIDLTKIAVGEVTEINGNEAIVKLEKDEGLVKARIINP